MRFDRKRVEWLNLLTCVDTVQLFFPFFGYFSIVCISWVFIDYLRLRKRWVVIWKKEQEAEESVYLSLASIFGMLRKAKYEFQNVKVRWFEASINNDYSQFKKRKKQPCVKNCREFFRENHQLISPTSATRHFPFAYTKLMSTPQECSVCGLLVWNIIVQMLFRGRRGMECAC